MTKDMTCSKYLFWTDIFKYGEKHSDIYHLNRLRFVDLFMEPNQKFIHMKNVAERLFFKYQNYDENDFVRGVMRNIKIQVSQSLSGQRVSYF